MFVHLYSFIITCLISSVCTDEPCKSWKQHRNFHLVHFQDDCGKVKDLDDTISSRIFNGSKSAPGIFPWMAFIYTKSGEKHLKCGGSIINDRYVLTAAHCVKHSNATVIVVVGLYDEKDIIRSITYGDEYAYKVTSIVNHLDVHGEQDGQLSNDIALLRVERKISFDSPYVNYICLPASCDYATTVFLGEYLLMAGWGLTSTNTDAKYLQQAELAVEKCETDDKSKLCTKGRSVKICSGDSGGPLMHLPNTRAYQIGIASTVLGECAADQLVISVFTKVSYFMTWILDNIKP